MDLNIGVTAQQREGVRKILTRLLSDECVLYAKTRNYYWNVAGPQSTDLHKFFQAQCSQLDYTMDEVAEEIRTLGGHAPGSLAEFLQHTRLKEQPDERPDAHTMIANLLADHETVIQALRADLEMTAGKYQDSGTNDFLTGVMKEHEKMAWMLRVFEDVFLALGGVAPSL